jgi:predicted transposase YdaD
MPYFKNDKNDLFWLDEGDDPAKWLPGCSLITEEEAEVLKQAKHAEWLASQPNKEQQIAQLQAQIDALKG